MILEGRTVDQATNMSMTAPRRQRAVAFPLRGFVIVTLVASLWVHASENFRFFLFIIPMMRETLSMVPDVVPMNPVIFASWGFWDTLLTAMTVMMCWLYARVFGDTTANAVVAGTLSWLFFFFLFWLAMLNLNLIAPATLAIELPLSWLELVVTSLIARYGFSLLEKHDGRLPSWLRGGR